jgi:hypothetical protein
MRASRDRQGGQSTIETMIMITFLSVMIFGFIHFGFLATTKYMASFAAFSVARTAMVGGNAGEQFQAAFVAMQYLSFGPLPIPTGPQSVARSTRPGYVVNYFVPEPFRIPGVFSLFIRGFAPFVRQPDIAETGDNAGS